MTALLALGLVAVAPAFAGSAFGKLFHEYQSTGAIKACKHSTSELEAAKGQVPSSISQYAPDFPAALQAAIEARARGVCGGAAAAATGAGAGSGGGGSASASASPSAPSAGGLVVSGTAPGATPAPLGSPAGPSPIATAAGHTGGGGASSLPAPLIALVVLLIALAAAGLWWTVRTLRAREPDRLGSTGHALGEARLRTGGTLREFADWLRLGR